MSVAAVSAKWKPYPAYKPSGVDWLGSIPVQWEILRLRHACSVNPPKSGISSLPASTEVSFLPMEAIGDDGQLQLKEVRAIQAVWQGYPYFKDGDVIVARITPCFENGKGGLCAGLLGGIGFGTTELHVLRPDAGITSSFLFYLTKSHPFRNLGIASMQGAAGQQRVTDEFVKDFRIAIPPVPEQVAIAAFLDRETEKIDALVARKERLIALLREKRAALITHAVTKGLNPSIPMKPSSVEWLGDIPAHWEVCRVRDVAASLQTGPFGSQLHSEEYVVGGTPVINPANLRGGRIEADWGCTVDETTRDRLAKHSLSDGDIVFARRGEMGRCGLVTQGEAGWLCGTGSLRVRLKGKIVNSSYVSLVFATSGTREWLQLESVGATMENLNTHIIGRIPMVVPPLSEQGEIGVFVERRVADIDSLASKVQDHIEKLREYRAALISAAVTGKFDVRDEVTA